MKLNWISVKDRLPEKNGQYLVVKVYFGFKRIAVVNFATNLYAIDKYDFHDAQRPGWYDMDDEAGYYEWTGITHWAELPELPEDET